MATQPAARIDEPSDKQMLDADTSAAILRWMETDLLPDGIHSDDWQRWIDAGCQGTLHARGVIVTAEMLVGRWARAGMLG